MHRTVRTVPKNVGTNTRIVTPLEMRINYLRDKITRYDWLIETYAQR